MAKRTTHSRAVYDAFAATPECQSCWACGWRLGRPATAWARLEISHMVGGAGRTADRRNLLMLCSGCHHGGAHGERIRTSTGEYIPRLTLLHQLWIKERRDPDYYDPAYIQSLRTAHAMTLRPERPPDWYEERLRDADPAAWARIYGATT